LANHKSAIKRAKQSLNKQMRNRAARTRVKNVTKQVRAAVDSKNREAAETALNKAKSVIHRAAAKGAIHKNKAWRKVSRLSVRVAALSVSDRPSGAP